jgi:nicotinic acid mononucleotide adenylyltransferase/nicotinamide mononucleotide (NMN) deamidase PncC
MTWLDELKRSDVNIHIVATGGGAGLQKQLWETPGCSAYLSGGSFPYSAEEQEELLGFMPEHFCSEEAAIDLASAAYMKAYKFGGKKPVGVGLAASVASEKEHRGEHRVHVCVITNDKVRSTRAVLKKEVGEVARQGDGETCDELGYQLLIQTIFDPSFIFIEPEDSTALALERFLLRPFFAANGKRLADLPKDKRRALMPGAYNPPHQGHFGMSQQALDQYGYETVFETTAIPPHKKALAVQQLLQRAKSLQGHDRLFTKQLPYYIDKARAYPGKPIILGADAMIRMLDPKWGLDINTLFQEFASLQTKLFISGRQIDDKFVTCQDILSDLRLKYNSGWTQALGIMFPLEGHWNISSTELREQLKRGRDE